MSWSYGAGRARCKLGEGTEALCPSRGAPIEVAWSSHKVLPRESAPAD
jgi:hypothetical protein